MHQRHTHIFRSPLNETTEEIEKLVRQAEKSLRQNSIAALNRISSTDIRPSDEAPVLLADDGRITCTWQRWGFPMTPGLEKGLVFNARCESAAEKPFFREDIRHRRAVVPAAAFYEWDREKTKYTFRKEDRKALFMAGCCRHYNDGEHFVILTTAANSSMEPIHDRMPLLLEETEVSDWLLNNNSTDELLRKIPPLLSRNTEYEQLSFF